MFHQPSTMRGLTVGCLILTALAPAYGFAPLSSLPSTQSKNASPRLYASVVTEEPASKSSPAPEKEQPNGAAEKAEEAIFFAKDTKEEEGTGFGLKTMLNDIVSAKLGSVESSIVPFSNIPSDYQTIEPGRYSNKDTSIAIPLLKRPPALDGSHAGDYGFDPLGFTEEYDLYTMQEAEIRHARLAMLAVIGWPMSELLAPNWMLQQNGCAPSVLNGFNPLSFVGFAAIFAAIGFFEYKTCFRQVANTPSGQLHKKDMGKVWKWGVAGDYGFDSLNLYSSIGNDAYSRKGLRDVEISHGRSAMLAITYFAFWEALTGHAIVENSMFFHPNLLLPLLAAGYAAFTSVYELEESDTFVRFKLNSEGAAKLENLKLMFRSKDDGAGNESALALPDTEGVMNLASEIKEFFLNLDIDGMINAEQKSAQK